ncbi:hypothetical protein OOK31_02365 [Streptomyces sp. NBC_00249]|uniref:hypothetical protein n=1 Tax=Streptomyces sp. NBC_00249 TaxID=2975690 RepID=UPI00224D70FC|nr:hypothetical protein [Streptomyces sp. NBC_00249]MCX5192744.1 hypothetical protein [Streptomyces sp. NBC_00249]
MRAIPSPRALRALSVLLLAAAAAPAAPALAAGPDFQYVGQDDRVHGLSSPKGCVEAEGGSGRAVTNHTRGTATLYREPHCKGAAVAVLNPGTVTQVRPYFASAHFAVTR